MADTSPIIVWIRRDLRLSDHAALHAAGKSGRPVIPVFIRDHTVDDLGAAPKWRLGLGLAVYAEALAEKGSRLVLRAGPAREVLEALVDETGAGAVWWQRAYDPAAIERDTAVKSALKDRDIDAQSFAGHLLFEPWTVETKQGGFYKVYSPFWRAVKDTEVPEPLPAPSTLAAPERWPEGDALEDWNLGAEMRRGAAVVEPYVQLGEATAQARLGAFTGGKIDAYKDGRNLVSEDGCSNLSENLSLGEISPAQCWHAGLRAMEAGKEGAETWVKELVWREFAYHLLWHTPHLPESNWREEWDAFPWNEDERRREVIAWKHGRTGIPFVDAAQREMYVTGRMHNRARMIVASYLTKHLMCHWKIGMKWFEDCLIDWDPASNSLGWQWTAGSGPDAAPYFRVFNPITQREKFDPDCAYVNRWIAEGQSNPPKSALSYFDAIPESWGMTPDDDYPEPVVSPDEGRKAALSAYENRDF
ncbi:MAG: deoxyribodipyrimidine photo-lyase [Rhodobacteraceae bacterium]|jgi:deoxyribodipyrimidine photo-lyase|uniref:Deoxyribodipyrimidine photo-lyase n=1 Tax=Salipiger profundus TaxID=1229727 RepID=A0A1U7DA81_9RHOB|nr:MULTISPECIES: deoxyribodipyrimidine photo-lyase [Salipiger]APX25071.1 deoxyribodipyrimidine photo-lyase [Salipiger profundus]MAB07578.1 deoxyribodipyrimidine photo-lyase [Paracoccaceae bacterium]